jgi:hypothetical protein
MAGIQSTQTSPSPLSGWRNVGTWALLVLLLASLVTRLFFVAANALSYDESHILTFGTLAARGFDPYRQVFIGIPPLAVLTVEWSALLFQDSHWVRLPLMLTGVLAVGTLFVLVRRHAPLHPIAAAAIAALLFSFNPHYFDISNTLNLEAAALCCALLAVWAMSNYARQRGFIWPLLSGAFFALSLAYKILVPFLPGVLLVQMILAVSQDGEARTWSSRLIALLRVGLLWVGGFALVLVIGSLLFSPQLVYQQVIDFRLDLRTATVLGGDDDVNVAEELEWLDIAQFIPIFLGALFSIPLLWRHRRDALWIWGAWLVLSLLFLTTHIPLRPRHLVITLPPLAALSGMAVAGWWVRASQTSTRAGIRMAIVGVLLFTLGSNGLLIGRTAPIEDFTENQPARADVIRYIGQNTAPDDCIISKENRFYFLTERFPPPYLSEVSTSRLFSGKLTSNGVVQEIDRHDCALFIYANSYDELAPGLREQADQYYSLELSIGDPTVEEPITVYAVPLDTSMSSAISSTISSAAPPATPLGFNIGEQIRLMGFELTDGPWTQEQTIYLSTYWQAIQPPSTDYRIFIQIVDEQGDLALSADHFPFELHPDAQISNIDLNAAYLTTTEQQLPDNYPNAGMIPTQLWRPGATLKETVAFSADLPPGQYEVRIGLYDPVTGERPDVDDAAPGGVENHIVLSTVIVSGSTEVQ